MYGERRFETRWPRCLPDVSNCHRIMEALVVRLGLDRLKSERQKHNYNTKYALQ